MVFIIFLTSRSCKGMHILEHFIYKRIYCVRIIMYCDFCGKVLSTNVKYCRHCGRRLRDKLEDTRPLPVIDESILSLSRIKRQVPSALPWSKSLLPRMTSITKAQMLRIMYGLVSFTTIVLLIYILMTFKKIEEYQILTAISASLLTIYTWQKSK